MDLTRRCAKMLVQGARCYHKSLVRNQMLMTAPKYASRAIPPKIFELITAHRNSQVLMAACDLKVFDELEKNRGRPMTAEDVANRLDLDPDATEKLLNVLVGMNMLKKHWDIVGTGLFANTDESKRCFLSSSKHNVTNYVMKELEMGVPAFNLIKETLQSGRLKSYHREAETDDTSTQGFIQSSNSPELLFSLSEAKNILAETLAPHLVSAFDFDRYNECIVIGDCSSIAVEMCNVYKHMQIKFLPTHSAASEVSLESKIPDNLVIQSFNVEKDDIPSCDLLILSHVIQEMDDESTKELLAKSSSALRTGGTLQILEKMVNEKKDGPMLALTNDLLLFMLKGGRSYSVDDFRKLLNPLGLSNIQYKIMVDDPFYDILIAEKTT